MHLNMNVLLCKTLRKLIEITMHDIYIRKTLNLKTKPQKISKEHIKFSSKNTEPIVNSNAKDRHN